mmetsp:Transcript_58064/g.173293  ORF Transcript_58064/g.173293 Transcript_58064/m.173293 type:complete len:621 (-) Transcript_58064:53-1915(-)
MFNPNVSASDKHQLEDDETSKQARISNRRPTATLQRQQAETQGVKMAESLVRSTEHQMRGKRPRAEEADCEDDVQIIRVVSPHRRQTKRVSCVSDVFAASFMSLPSMLLTPPPLGSNMPSPEVVRQTSNTKRTSFSHCESYSHFDAFDMSLVGEREDCSMRKNDESRAMASTHEGRAWLFVEAVLGVHEQLQSQWTTNHVAPVSTDDMVWLAERLMRARKNFEESKRPAKVDLGYHFTSAHNMRNIRKDGLMSYSERKGHYSGTARSRGAYFGHGVYTANNPFSFRHLGDVCLLVARLQGVVKYMSGRAHHFSSETNSGGDCDTVVGNKHIPIFSDEVVLLRSSQCLPLICFSASLVSLKADEARGNIIIHAYHEKIQRLIDDYLNGGFNTAVLRPMPSMRFSLASVRVSRQENRYLSLTHLPVAFPGLCFPLLAPGTHPQWNISNQKREIGHCMKKCLLFMLHASICSTKTDLCPLGSSCHRVKSVWDHFVTCKNPLCSNQSCAKLRSAMGHYTECRENACLICSPVRYKIIEYRKIEDVRRECSSQHVDEHSELNEHTPNNEDRVKKPSEVSVALWNKLARTPSTTCLTSASRSLQHVDYLATLRGRAQRERLVAGHP